MERFGGFLLLVAGAAIGSYALMPPAPPSATDPELSMDILTAPKRAAPHSRTTQRPREDREQARTFSPTSPAFQQRARLVAPEETADPAAAPTTGTWATVVTRAQTGTTALKSPKPADRQTRFELARDLQRELKRVGCYGGIINGTWTRSTKAAMTTFIERVNASLPVDDPDYILLTLVQNHSEKVCGSPCPSGQVEADGGRCVPRAVVAQAARKSKRLEDRRIAAAALGLTAGEKTDHRGAVANDRAARPPQAMAATEPEKLPWLENSRPAAPLVARRTEAFEGRMAMGGPAAEPLPRPSVAATGSDWQRVPIQNHTGADGKLLAQPKADGSPPKVVVLTTESDPDSDDATAAVAPETATVPPPSEVQHKTYRSGGNWKPSRRARRDKDDDWRPSSYDPSTGRRRRGDPRPGTMRYNVARVLGGIY